MKKNTVTIIQNPKKLFLVNARIEDKAGERDVNEQAHLTVALQPKLSVLSGQDTGIFSPFEKTRKIFPVVGKMDSYEINQDIDRLYKWPVESHIWRVVSRLYFGTKSCLEISYFMPNPMFTDRENLFLLTSSVIDIYLTQELPPYLTRLKN